MIQNQAGVKEAKEPGMGGWKPPVNFWFIADYLLLLKAQKRPYEISFSYWSCIWKQAYLKVTLGEGKKTKQKTMAHTESRSVCARQYFSIHTPLNRTDYLPRFVDSETLILSVLYLHIQQIHSIFPPFKSQ